MKQQPHITLPPCTADRRPSLSDTSSCRIVIVGANGAGKSRFAARMAADAGERAFTLSALSAIFSRGYSQASASSIDRLYAKASAENLHPDNESTQLERLMWLLMRDEMINLINYKVNHAADPSTQLASTKLDEIIAIWQEIFPDNKVLIESGRMLFARRPGSGSPDTDDRYSALKLSAGEKAVIYYLGAITYAPRQSVVFVDSPEMFLHPTILQAVWNRIELLRPDCTFVYTTHDLDFASTRTSASVIWVRGFDAKATRWDYTILPPDAAISDDIYAAILGARKPVLFIEGDGRHSIDAKLYSLIFKDFTVKPLGSCNKVIEATRSFNTLSSFHKMDSYGIVDRDRRDSHEVEYLRGKRVMVPNVAEVENILMLEGVIRAVAHHCGKDENRVFGRVKRSVINQFASDMRQQALLHTRHRVKRTVEYRIDGRFNSIGMLEQHMQNLMHEINPRGLYESFLRDFSVFKANGDYSSILRVYNQKSMLPSSNVAGLCGLANKEEYIDTILEILRTNAPDAQRLTLSIRECFNLPPSAAAPIPDTK